MEKQENLKAKYGITSEELKAAVDQIKHDNVACSSAVFCAMCDLLANGDLDSIAPQSKIVFASVEHKQFYNEKLNKSRSEDPFHRALFYTLGILEDTRNHFDEIYDMQADEIKPASIHKGWVTGTDGRAMRLAFNLFTCNIPEESEEELYSVSEIFSYNLQKYFLQAIALWVM